MRILLFISLISLFTCPLFADIPYWNCYGETSIDWFITDEDYHSGIHSGEMSNPTSSTYKILYQSVAIESNKSYSAEVWVKNINYTNTDYVKLRLGFWKDDSWQGNSFKTYQDQNTVTLSSWVKLSILNQAANLTNHYARVGLYVHYPSIGNYKAYWDDVWLYATDNPSVNLLQNGDFETTTGPSGSGEDTIDITKSSSNIKITLDRKIFSPHDNEKVKINFNLPYKNSDLLIRAYDIKGNIIRDIYNTDELGSTFSSCSGTVYWDGKDDFGKIVHIGPYFIYLEATNKYTGEVTRLKALIIVGRALE